MKGNFHHILCDGLTPSENIGSLDVRWYSQLQLRLMQSRIPRFLLFSVFRAPSVIDSDGSQNFRV